MDGSEIRWAWVFRRGGVLEHQEFGTGEGAVREMIFHIPSVRRYVRSRSRTGESS